MIFVASLEDDVLDLRSEGIRRIEDSPSLADRLDGLFTCEVPLALTPSPAPECHRLRPESTLAEA
eukprot:CAMPEP_0118949162 /NCGR_PEP_ID=MMETSP1169-20130426/49137_1 /TAXON_ID=36882 /ORGANISM="Pyramimonas obovata, Strain CCMP722" /LENGTH=64 /DNA_ID=CAMNT_0006895729 /DNA_START=269 /DNA_END=463 /DNA_ORIENTATION=-